jgi:murein DD-endopeptidase MepM/ murein hydrolase activator NlpD
MRPQTKAKTNTNKKARIISALLIAGVLFVAQGSLSVRGDTTAAELQKQKDEKQKQLADIQRKISDFQSQIKDVLGQANTLKNQLNIINLQVAQTQAQISETENKIDSANLEIADVTNKIIQTEKDIAKQKETLKSLILQINELDQQSPLEIALANDNFEEFLNQVQYTTSIQEQSQDALGKIKQLNADLEIRQSELKTQKANLDALLKQLDLTKAGLVGQQAAKQQLLDLTRGQERSYQKLLTEEQAEQKALADEINNLDSQIAAKLGNRKLSPIHGLLAYPMQGTMTQGYGNTGFTSLGYNFHNGIDLAASANTPIYAAGDGTVNATGTGEGAYGNWVTIKHDTGKFAAHPIVSLYGHMTSFVVKKGQVVKMGDLVGFEGNTGNTTRLLYGPHRGYHLHFTIFDAEGFGISQGAYPKVYGPYQVPYGAPYNPLDFL